MLNMYEPFQEANHRYQNLLEERAQDRLASQARAAQPPMIRRMARLAGGMLVQLGIQLLRVGQVELAHTLERLNPPVRQSRFN